MSLLDQSGVTGGGLDPYNALFVNMDNMWTERFGNYYCLVFQEKAPILKESVKSSTAFAVHGAVHFIAMLFFPKINIFVRFCTINLNMVWSNEIYR